MGNQTGTAGLETESPVIAAMSLKMNKLHQDGVRTRLSALLETGRCTPAEAKSHGEKIGAIRLSLDGSGELKAGELEKWIASREPCPPGTFWEPARRTQMAMGSLVVEEPPEDLGGDMTDEQATDLADRICKRPAKTTA